MKIIYSEKLNSEQVKLANTLALECGITFDTARLLVCRDIDSVEKAKRFLNPSKNGFYNPAKLSGMLDAVQRITDAKIKGESILIFGDYDADGVCASTVLYYSLKDFGINSVRVYVPEREEGYALNVETIKSLMQDFAIDLLITVDCGISDAEKIEELKKLGIDVIVTDHHEPPEVLPDCIKINPKLSGQEYPFSGLCGAGVAYKLSAMLIKEKADEYLDFVALATVADSMELVDENRDIVSEGLKILNNPNKQRLAFKYLINDNTKKLTAQSLAFQIAPRINAGGRMGDANCALKLFTCENPNTIFDLAVKLNEYNVQRQVECDNIYQQARQKILKHSLHKKNVILVKDKKWQVGFIGIVAAKLVEEFARPVIVFAGQDEFLKGSARSVEGINIYEAIDSVKNYLLGFGGHSQAAGVSVTEENFLAFEKAVNQAIGSQKQTLDITPKINVEWEIDRINPQFVKEIDMLEPFGIGNRKPLFTKSVYEVEVNRLKAGSNHYGFKCDDIEMIDFNGENDVLPLSLSLRKDVVFEFNLSIYKGKEYIKGFVKTVCPDYSDMSNLQLHVLNAQLDSLLENAGEFEYISKQDIKHNGIGTLFVICDLNNIKEYDFLTKINKNFAGPKSKNYSDELIFSFKKLPEGYEKIIYLDKPMQVVKSKVKTYVVKDVLGYKILDNLSVEREDFKQAFNYILTLKNKQITNIVSFVKTYANGITEEQLLFSLKVFIELGIFEINNGLLTYNEKVKNALTNSKVYSKIVLIKG